MILSLCLKRGFVLAIRKPDSLKTEVRINIESQFQSSQLACMGQSFSR